MQRQMKRNLWNLKGNMERILLTMVLLGAVACGSGGTGGQNDTIDFDELDVDFDALDVDIAGFDLQGNLDVLKQDTVGGDDARDDGDVAGTDAAGTDTAEEIAPDVGGTDAAGSDVAGSDAESPDVPGSDAEGTDVAVDVPPECTAASDCADADACTMDACSANGTCTHSALSCDDSNVCTDDSCNSAIGCVNAPNASTCTDGDACTIEACAEGKCKGGGAQVCDDLNGCTTDSCDSAEGCVFLANTATCSDGNVCTVGDICGDSVCIPGAPSVCVDDNLCTDDGCAKDSGCVFTANTKTCDDGNICTIKDTCMDAMCMGTDKDCDDGNPCTLDICDQENGCLHSASNFGGNCTDNNACTKNDACDELGSCVGTSVFCIQDENPCTVEKCDPTVGCVQLKPAIPCDDGEPCTLNSACKDGVCLGGDVTDCNDGNGCSMDVCVTGEGCDNSMPVDCADGNTCTVDSCEIPSGCTHTSLENGARCDDGNACTANESCNDGACGLSTDVTCQDENVCTDDSCDVKFGCVNLANSGTCTDGSACTIGDFCADKYCVGGYPIVCDDGNPCTTDSCNSSTSGSGETTVPAGCVAAPADYFACDDNNPCSLGDYCYGSICYGGEGDGCDDGNACTNDSCSESQPSGCSHTINPDASECSDGNVCTYGDSCDPQTGACKGGVETQTCFDEDNCTSDVCDPTLGCNYPSICDDGDPCTLDSCDQQAQCGHTSLLAFSDTFSKGNLNGWTLDKEWEIGVAKLGPGGDVPPGDPALDHTLTDDNMLAGVKIGGMAERVLHGYYYLTSPVIDVSGMKNPAVEFWRWLDSDYPNYMTNTIEFFDGNAWQTVWVQPNSGATIHDSQWNRQFYELGPMANAKFQFRIGFKIEDEGVYSVGSWNVDDVRVGEVGTCLAPDIVKIKQQLDVNPLPPVQKPRPK